uniref:hypothetical protein n=1 Tax=Nocardioides jensenii TaxID=1843 RepID=UPI000B07E730
MNDVQQNAIRSYRPGGWYSIFGDHASVLLPPSEKARVGALWELVDGGAGFDELLDALIASGLRSLPGFVLVSTVEDPTRIVLRGAARAVVTLESGETIEVDGGAAATWVEQALSGVASLQLVLEDEEDGNAVDFAIRGGLVRAARVDQPPYAATGAPAASGSSAAAEPAPPVAESSAPGETVSAESGASSSAPSSSAPSSSVSTGGVAMPVVAAAPGFDPLTDDLPDEAVAQEPTAEEPTAEEPVVEEPARDAPPQFFAQPTAEAGAQQSEAPAAEAGPPQFFAAPVPEADVPRFDAPATQPSPDVEAAQESVPDAGHEAGADVPTEAHAFPFFNDPEPEADESVADAPAEEPAPERPATPEPPQEQP